VRRVPRLLPVIAVAIGGALALRAIAGAFSLPQLMSTAAALAEDVAPKSGPKDGGKPKKDAPPIAPNASIVGTDAAATTKPTAPVCAPTAAELAKEAGLSPAELQVLQSLGTRRGQLDEREQSLDVQVQLIAAAEAKLDSRIGQMTSLKADIQALLGQADQQQQAETGRLVKVYEAMKPKDAAARITLMSDAVRLPMTAAMKDRALSAILAQMPPEDAKALTEKLANRVTGAAAVANARSAVAPAPAAAPTASAAAAPTPAKPGQTAPAAGAQQAAADSSDKPAPAAKPKPKRLAKAKPKPAPKAKPVATAAQTAASPPAVATAKPSAAGSTPPAAPAPAKTG
jgi:flagellar motility protein MotE (MotC chaperone)